MKTGPRALMDMNRIKDLFKLKDTCHILMNHPFSYAAKQAAIRP